MTWLYKFLGRGSGDAVPAVVTPAPALAAAWNMAPEATVLIRPPARAASSGRAASPEQTRLFGRMSPEDDGKSDGADDPVVGWVVVLDGPGKGKALPLGYGVNSIGRGESERVPLSFGDEEISRLRHTAIAYDPLNRQFFVQPGDGTNLTYLERAPILLPTELKGGETLRLGRTRLKFVPFCGPHFDWQGA
jgi:hypothetical protein